VRILSNVQDLGPTNGITVQTMQTTVALCGRGHRVDLAYVADGPFRGDYEAAGTTLVEVPLLDLHLRGALGAARAIAPSVRSGVALGPDVIYAHRMQPLPWAVATGARARRPVVSHLHGITGCTHRVVNTLLGRRPRTVLSVSSFLRDQLVAGGFPARRVEVVHNGIDPDAYPFGDLAARTQARDALGIDQGAFVVLFYGRLDPTKGVDVLLDAVARMRDAGSGVQLLMIGSPATVDYLRAIRPRLRQPGVTWLPNRPDVVTPLHAADVVAAPSVWDEPFGRVVVEAMSTGRPVVATAVGGIPEVLTGPFARFLVPRSDPDELARRLSSLATWRTDEPGLGADCRAHVADHFTLVSMVAAIEHHLEVAAGV